MRHLEHSAYPDELKNAEQTLLGELDYGAETARHDDRNQVGVGLSGGGIRSATFALGFFQGLSKRGKTRPGGLLGNIGYLSTVSGGGYFGGFLGRLFTRPEIQSSADVEDVLRGTKHPEILRYLRENGRYLSPNGGGDSLLFGASLLRNWVALQLVMTVFFLCLFFGLQALRAGLEAAAGSNFFFWPQAGALLWWSPVLWLPLAALIIWAVPAGWAYWLVEPENLAIQKERPSSGPASGAIPEGARQPAAPPPRAQDLSAIPPIAGLLMVLVASAGLALCVDEIWAVIAWTAVSIVAILTWLASKIALWQAGGMKRNDGDEVPGKAEVDSLYINLKVRNLLGISVTWALVTTGLLFIWGLIDTLGQSAYAVLAGTESSIGRWLTGILGSLGLAGLGRWIAMFFAKGPQGGRPAIPIRALALVAALLLSTAILVTLNGVSHAVAWGGKRPADAPSMLVPPAGAAASRGSGAGAEKGGVAAETRIGRQLVWIGSPSPSGADSDRSLVPAAASLAAARGASASDGAPPSGGNWISKARRITKDIEIRRQRDVWGLTVAFLGTLLLSVVLGQTWPFVNRSSHLPTYGSRLTRAYLGASNRSRLDGNSRITEPVEGDDTDLAGYWAARITAKGGPIHLINVTINETIDSKSQVQQQDRKGVGLALGPCAWSAGVQHHMLTRGDEKDKGGRSAGIEMIFPRSGRSGDYRVFDYPVGADGRIAFPGEALSLGTWTSISGAAFSTGAGMRTSLGISLLAGLANVRLGHWWDSGLVRKVQVNPDGTLQRRRSLRWEDFLTQLFPVQMHLLDEYSARFPGSARQHWYLSDGGHFENMGGYELIRRRLPFIVIVDAEMDPNCRFDGIANLIRKARLDFGAEISFLNDKDLDRVVREEARPHVSSLDHLHRGAWQEAGVAEKGGPVGKLEKPADTGLSLAHAALARVTYGKTPVFSGVESQESRGAQVDRAWLLYVKPTLTGDEPGDVLQYHVSHPQFPHESTIDQFFDEAQWESYRRLGEHIADQLFNSVGVFIPRDGSPSFIKDWDFVPSA